MAGNVFGAIGDALAGKSTPGSGTLNKVGYDKRPVPVPASVAAARAAMIGAPAPAGTSGMDQALSAHADKLHPVKR